MGWRETRTEQSSTEGRGRTGLKANNVGFIGVRLPAVSWSSLTPDLLLITELRNLHIHPTVVSPGVIDLVVFKSVTNVNTVFNHMNHECGLIFGAGWFCTCHCTYKLLKWSL